MPIVEFKVAPPNAADRSRERTIRLFLWACVLVMAGLTLFAVYYAHSASPELVRALGWLAIVIVNVTILAAYFLAARLGLRKLERDLVFVLTDNEVVCRRRGRPDTQIGFSDITALYQRHGWLIVESNQAQHRIAIPEGVDGFNSLRAKLVKHHPIVAAPQPSPMGFIPVVASLVCWGLVLWSREAGVVFAAGTVALLLLVWESFRLFGKLRHSPKRVAISLLIGLSWIAAALLIYLRVIRDS